MQKKDDKVGNKTANKKKAKATKESERERLKYTAKKSLRMRGKQKSYGKNPVRLYPKLQSQPIGLRKSFIDYLFFQADQSDCSKICIDF